MADEKIIKWQFVEEYYKHLIKKIQKIDYYLSLNEYDFSFAELHQILIQISGPLTLENKKFSGVDKYIELIKLKNKIKKDLRTYQSLELKEKHYKKDLIELSTLKNQIEDNIYLFYQEIMLLLDILNMLFPREQNIKETGFDRVMKKYAGYKEIKEEEEE